MSGGLSFVDRQPCGLAHCPSHRGVPNARWCCGCAGQEMPSCAGNRGHHGPMVSDFRMTTKNLQNSPMLLRGLCSNQWPRRYTIPYDRSSGKEYIRK